MLYFCFLYIKNSLVVEGLTGAGNLLKLRRPTDPPKSQSKSPLDQLSPPASPQDDCWLQLSPRLGRFWVHLGHFFDHFWVLPWPLHLRSLLHTILIDFWSMFKPSDLQKHSPCRWFWGSLHLLHDRSWDRSWTDFGSILDPKIVPKSVPRGSGRVLEIMVVFACLRELPKIDFWANMAPTWPPRRPQVGAKTEPKSVQKLFLWIIFHRFWADVGSNLDQFCMNIWVDIWPGVVSMLGWVLIDFCNDFFVDFW